jgi:hypothetical protein
MTVTIGRRELLVALGGAAAAWPLAARAQQRPRRIAALMGTVETAPDALGLKEVLDRLKGLGWVDGTTAHIDVRWSRSDLTLMRKNAEALLAAAPDVILCHSNPALAQLKPLAGNTPIVFVMVAARALGSDERKIPRRDGTRHRARPRTAARRGIGAGGLVRRLVAALSLFGRVGDVAAKLVHALVHPAFFDLEIWRVPILAYDQFGALLLGNEALLAQQHDFSVDLDKAVSHARSWRMRPCRCWFAAHEANILAGILTGFDVKDDPPEVALYHDHVAKLGPTLLFAMGGFGHWSRSIAMGGKWRPDAPTSGRCAVYMRTLAADAKKNSRRVRKNLHRKMPHTLWKCACGPTTMMAL